MEEEAAKPILSNKTKNIKKFELNIKNEEFLLIVGEGFNDIIIFTIQKKGIELLTYENEFSYKDLIKINENFQLFNSINNLYNSFDSIFTNNNIIIEKDEKNTSQIKLGLLIYDFLGNKIKCLLNLKLKEMEEHEYNKKLLYEISELKKLIEKKDNEIKALKEKVDMFAQKFEIIETLPIISREIKIDKLLKANELQLKKSDIIKNSKDIELLINRLIKDFDNLYLELVYKPTNKDEKAEDFHNACDGKQNVIVLIKTDDNIKFGGFTSVGFNSFSGNTRDDKAFLFSLDNNKIYEIKKGNNAIYCNQHKGPCFLGYNWYNINISNNIFTDLHNSASAKNNPYEINWDYELNGGKQFFKIQNLEIYQVKSNI